MTAPDPPETTAATATDLAALAELLGRSEELPLTLLGLYAAGATVLGEAAGPDAPRHFVAVVEERPDEDAVARIGSAHADLRARGARLSGSWAVRADLSSPMGLGRRWWAVDHDADAPLLTARDNTATARWVLRERGRVVAGPTPSDLVAPVPPEVLAAEALGLARTRGEAVEEEPALLLDPATRSALVDELCVALHAATTGEVAGPGAARSWCRAEVPDLAEVVALDADAEPADVRRLVWEVHSRVGSAVSRAARA